MNADKILVGFLIEVKFKLVRRQRLLVDKLITNYSTFSIGATLGIILVTPMLRNFTARVAF